MNKKQIPNILTTLRLLCVPVFIWLLVQGEGDSLAAACLFIAAALTDALDGYLARRWDAISTWGKLVDPLADRALIQSAVICLVVYGLIPWYALVLLARDVLLLGTYFFIRSRIELNVSYWGKVSTAGLMLSLTLVLFGAQTAGNILLNVSLVLAFLVGLQYVWRYRKKK